MYKHHLYAVFLRQTRVFPAVCRRFLLTMARRSRQIVFTPVWAHGVAKCHLGNVGPGGGSGSGRGRFAAWAVAVCGLLRCKGAWIALRFAAFCIADGTFSGRRKASAWAVKAVFRGGECGKTGTRRPLFIAHCGAFHAKALRDKHLRLHTCPCRIYVPASFVFRRRPSRASTEIKV